MSTSGNSEKSTSTSRWKNLLKNLALSAVFFLFCLAAFELILRSLGYGKFDVPLQDATEDLRPRAKDLYLEGDTVHLNAVGHEIIGRRLADVVSPLHKQ